MPTVKAEQIIKRAFDDLNCFAPNEPLPPTEGQDGLRRLNAMLGSLGLQPLTMPVIAREVFDTVSGQGGPSNPYTIGPGGDLDTTRPAPNAITGAGLLLAQVGSSARVEIPRAPIDDEAYEAIQIKELQSPLFTLVYYNATYRVGGLGTIFLWPVPNTSQNDLVLYRQELAANFTSLTADYELPAGYEEMLEYQLALRLSIPYGKPVPPEIRQFAISSLATVKRSNVKFSDLPVDPMFLNQGNRRGWYNIQTGQGGGS